MSVQTVTSDTTSASATPSSTGADEAARTSVAALEAAWNAGDGAGFGAEFTDDAVFVDIRGARHRSREVIAAGHQGILESIYRGSTVGYVVESVDEVAPGVALAHVAASLDAPTGPLAGTSRSNATLVLVEVRGAWRVHTFHNTLVVA